MPYIYISTLYVKFFAPIIQIQSVCSYKCEIARGASNAVVAV